MVIFIALAATGILATSTGAETHSLSRSQSQSESLAQSPLRMRSNKRQSTGSSSDVAVQKSSFSAMFKNIWPNIKGMFKRTIRSIFGDREFWDKTFLFKIPEKFKNWSLEKYSKLSGTIVENPPSFLETDSDTFLAETSTAGPNPDAASDLPTDYFFLDKYPECLRVELDQGSCGSCWAFAIAGTLSHRVCKALKDAGKKVNGNDLYARLSPQLLISCATDAVSAGADGCRGGKIREGFSLLSPGTENALGYLKCQPYYSFSGFNAPKACPHLRKGCEAPGTTGINKNTVKISADPSPVIGEAAMMRAVYERGPIVVTMMTPSNFIGASGVGIYARNGAPFLPGGSAHRFHAVTLHGWGFDKETNTKFWIIENSWGETYRAIPNGNRAFLRVLRGTNDMFLEALRQFEATPVLSSGKPISEAWVDALVEEDADE